MTLEPPPMPSTKNENYSNRNNNISSSEISKFLLIILLNLFLALQIFKMKGKKNFMM